MYVRLYVRTSVHMFVRPYVCPQKVYPISMKFYNFLTMCLPVFSPNFVEVFHFL